MGLKKRLTKNPKHYKRNLMIDFAGLEKALRANPLLTWGLYYMEETGGQPDVIEETEDYYIFADCSAESPFGRYDLTYDQAVAMAKEFGIEMFDEASYLKFKQTGTFDTKTSNWVVIQKEIRSAGQALYRSNKGMGQCSAMDKDTRRGFRGFKKLPKKR